MAVNRDLSELVEVAASSQQDCDLPADGRLEAMVGEKSPAVEKGASPPSLGAEGSYGPDDMTCAICLEQIQLENTAYVKGCEHAYCAKCILQWAELREDCSCPQCKNPFSRLLTYRTLDGTMSDFPVEESICLLKRATWVQGQLKTAEKGKAVASADAFYMAEVSEPVTDWQDYSNYYDEYDDDEEVEDYYFSSAAGRARIVLGNRRWGENGYVASGRQQGRPVQRTASKAAQGSSSAKKAAVGKQAAAKKDAGTPSSKAASPAGAQRAAEDAITLQATPLSHQDAKSEGSATVTEHDAGTGAKISSPPTTSMPTVSAAATATTPIAISGSRNASVGRRSSGSDIAGTSAEGAWGSANSGSGWASYRQGKKKCAMGADPGALGKSPGALGKSPGSDAAAGCSKAGRRARRNAKKAAADAKADVYAY